MFLHVTDAVYDKNYILKLKFNNGAEGTIDLAEELYGEIFEPLKNIDLFQNFMLTGRTIEWPNGADFAPEYLWKMADLSVEPATELLYF